MYLLIGSLQMYIAVVMLHKTMPHTARNIDAIRIWFFALGMACQGAAYVIGHMNYNGSVMMFIGHVGYVVSGLLWLKKAKGSWVNTTFK